jgi:hypothetical protein
MCFTVVFEKLIFQAQLTGGGGGGGGGGLPEYKYSQ